VTLERTLEEPEDWMKFTVSFWPMEKESKLMIA
jgi:hypothetical protein